MKKKLIPPLITVMLLLFLIPGNVKAATFNDVADTSWYATPVAYCYEHGYMAGLTAKTFGPEETMSRAMLVTVLYRAAGQPSVSGNNPFSDVAANTWYTNAVIWGVANHIVYGYDNGTFSPDQAVSRQELMVFLYRYLVHQGEAIDGTPDATIYNSFDDTAAVGSWAKNAATWCTSVGLISGSENALLPLAFSTRAQVASIMQRLDCYLTDETYTITAMAGLHGTISPAGTATLVNGAAVTYRFIPDSGYMVDDVKVDSVSAGYMTSKTISLNGANHTVTVTFKKVSGDATSGYAQLVNRTYTIANASSYAPGDLAAVSYANPGKGTQYLRSEAATAMNQMLSAFKKVYPKLTIYAQSGYRSYATQETLYGNQITKQGNNIYKAGTISAIPGTSEHQLGLAMDLSTDGTLLDSFGSTTQGKWFAAHCYEYGYILRYPADKQTITGIIYEPWHFRYVGVAVATEMKQMGVTTLEEYYGLYLSSADLDPYLPYLK